MSRATIGQGPVDKNTAFIFQKPSCIIKEYGQGSHLIDFYGDVFDLDAPYPMFRRHKDGMYYHCGELMESWGTLTFDDGPRFGRFIGQVFGSEHCGRFISKSYYLLSSLKDTMTKFVFVEDVDVLRDNCTGFYINDIVGMMYYAQMAGIPLGKCYVCKHAVQGDVLGTAILLSEAWAQVKDQVPEEPEGGVRQVLRLMTLSGMSKREFADYFGIKHRTVENWVYLSKSDIPDWAVPLMELKLEVDGRI